MSTPIVIKLKTTTTPKVIKSKNIKNINNKVIKLKKYKHWIHQTQIKSMPKVIKIENTNINVKNTSKC
jgi:hypothetical protein